MRAIIMAGGEGTRLRPVSGRCPKPMVPLLGRPLLEHTLLLLRKHGVIEVCMALRHMPDAITGYFGDGARFGMRIEYRIENEPMGTAGGVRACSNFLVNEPALVISGDAATDFDLTALIREHTRRSPAVTMALRSDPEPLQYGLVVTDSSGRVVGFVEKPPWRRVITDLVNTGIYILSPKTLLSIPRDTKYDFAKDLFPALMREGETILGVRMDGYWCDVGNPEAYRRCCLDALGGSLDVTRGEAASGYGPGSFVSENASVEPGAELVNSVIESGAVVGAGSVVTDSVVSGSVGGGSVLRGAIVCAGAVVPSGSVLPKGSIAAPWGEPAPERSEPERRPLRRMREVPCRSRAAMMRVMSEAMAEFGADFTDGLVIRDEKGTVRISPSETREAICIESDAKSDSAAAELGRKYEAMAKKLGQNA